MKRPYTKMYMERKYRERRQVAIAVIIGLTVILTMLFCPVGDATAEKVCVTQLDKKSAWAVQYSKDQGEYPYE
ncbi:hypothetical protein [Aedoeadaptatus coxii]|uniref:hypothetical protein n=1 Tax=Aedoeadaptatus coxii TaxID=755172 RepID=UPI002AD26378|nr:hypothetical protein [Peptoniphilus coxii]